MERVARDQEFVLGETLRRRSLQRQARKKYRSKTGQYKNNSGWTAYMVQLTERWKSAASWRISEERWANSSGRMDCMPSDKAFSG